MSDESARWIDAYNEVCERLGFAETLGLDLSEFRVSCNRCAMGWRMNAEELLQHIDVHIKQTQRRAA